MQDMDFLLSKEQKLERKKQLFGELMAIKTRLTELDEMQRGLVALPRRPKELRESRKAAIQTERHTLMQKVTDLAGAAEKYGIRIEVQEPKAKEA